MIKKFGAAIGFALAVSAAVPACAQNNKPIISGNFYEDRSYNTGSNDLILAFALTPADKYLTITRLYCRFNMSSSVTLTYVRMRIGTTSGGVETGRTHFIDLPVNGTIVSSIKVYQTSQPLSIKVGPGRYPNVEIYGLTDSGGASLSLTGECQIVGDLSDS